MVLNKPLALPCRAAPARRSISTACWSDARPDGQRPRLVHRLDKETSGCLLVAKTRFAAAALAKDFRSRSARKIYWALVGGRAEAEAGAHLHVSGQGAEEEDSFMRVAQHGDEGASHAVTYYAVVETAASKAWPGCR